MAPRALLTMVNPAYTIEVFFSEYQDQFGVKKFREVINKVDTSRNMSKFINRLLKEKLSPGYNDFIITVYSIPYFFLAKGETVGCAALFSIKKWLDFQGEDFYTPPGRIHRIIIETVLRAEQTKIHISNKSSFFDDYFDALLLLLQLNPNYGMDIKE